MKPQNLTKGLKSQKAESRLVLIVAAATVISVFCLVSAKTLLGQAMYHKRVIDARHSAVKQLNANVDAANALVQQYQVFQSGNQTNIIGGKNSTDANLKPPDGDNARIVLDALPSHYDFPALISSVAAILSNNGVKDPSVNGTDDSGTINSSPTAKPEVTTITLDVKGTTNYKSARSLIKDLERSIRPFDVTKVDIEGSDSNMVVTLTVDTYFQPALTLDLTTKEVK
ncbi:MAG TPA: hypothetical protein VFW52_03550 [Candidatus Saccharimonadales bacterium]|nr:hypothetical protein [Candidatus Saccharimonadales bacterium]